MVFWSGVAEEIEGKRLGRGDAIGSGTWGKWCGKWVGNWGKEGLNMGVAHIDKNRKNGKGWGNWEGVN